MPSRLRWLVGVGALAASVLVALVQSQNGVRAIAPDFIARYAAAEVAGDGGSPYDDEAVIAEERRLGLDDPLAVFDPPPAIAAFRLLTPLPVRAAVMVLTGLSLAAVALLARRLTAGRSAGAWILVTVGLLQASPVRHTLTLGQTDLVALAVVLLVAAAQPALAVLKPQTTGPTALALFVRRATAGRGLADRRQAALHLGAAVVGAAVLVVGSAALAGDATWADWLAHLDDRAGGAANEPWLLLVALAGVVVLVHGLVVARRTGSAPDVVLVAAAATGLLAAMGGWNPQWFLAIVLPLGTLIVRALTGRVELDPWQKGLLLLAAAAAAGDGFVSFHGDPGYQPLVPLAGVVALVVGLVALRTLSPLTGGAVVAAHVAIALPSLGQVGRIGVAMAVAVVVLHLTLTVRPDP